MLRRLFAISAVFVLATVCFAEEGKRMALIIGNDAYSVRPLANAINDARAMDAALRGAGFRTTLKENASRQQMEEAFSDFISNLGPDDTALFYYAGHAIQINGENFVIPVDFQQAPTVIGAKYKMFSLSGPMDELSHQRHKRTIIILDACRSNPVADTYALEAGLAIPLKGGSDTYVAFSTSPGHVATDNPNGRNSYFTEALADLITQLKDRDLSEIMTKVRSRVGVATEGKQTPWDQSSLTSKFYFYQQSNAVAENDPTLSEKWMRDEQAREQLGDWDEALLLVNQIAAKKEAGELENRAKARIPFLNARRDAQTAFDAGKYSDAAKLFQHAYDIDPFSIDSALGGVNSYLLADDLDDAVSLIHSIRIRGASADVQRAELMLKELSPVDTKADAELRAGVPAPPPIEEVFAGFPFGRIDPATGDAFAQEFSPEIGPQLVAAVPVIAPGVTSVATVASLDPPQLPPGVTIDTFHLEIIAEHSAKSRDFAIRATGPETVNTPGAQRPGTPIKVTTTPSGADLAIDGDPEEKCTSPCLLTLRSAPQTLRVTMDGYRSETRELAPKTAGEEVNVSLTQQFGFVSLDGSPGETPVVFDGQLAAHQVPSKVQLPAGKYQIRGVQNGKVLSQDDIEVKPSDTLSFKVAH